MEQLKSANLGEVCDVADLEMISQPETSLILLIDEAAADKKHLKALHETEFDRKKKRIFFLGEAKSDWDKDFITESFGKPIRLGHLLARMQFYSQAAPRLLGATLVFGPYRFEPYNRQIVKEANGDIIRLTEKETALLDYIGQSETPLSREELLSMIWGYDAQIDTHTLETHIYQIRRKLNPDGIGTNWLLNEQGFYRLNRVEAAP